MKAYNTSFSIMKGLAIISVVIGHCPSNPFIEDFVNQYHLAVFFFVAGYFFKTKYLSNMKKFVGKRVKSLYVPFVSFCLTFLLLHNFFYRIDLYSTPLTISESVLGGGKNFI